jgi:hypothetical protein
MVGPVEGQTPWLQWNWQTAAGPRTGSAYPAVRGVTVQRSPASPSPPPSHAGAPLDRPDSPAGLSPRDLPVGGFIFDAIA